MDNKTLIGVLSRQLSISSEQTAELLADFSNVLTDVLLNGDTVAVPSFGNFEPKKRQERLSVHPLSGKRLLIPPKLVVAFKPSAILKSKIN